jgi:hypothetical protein
MALAAAGLRPQTAKKFVAALLDIRPRTSVLSQAKDGRPNLFFMPRGSKG